MGKLRLTEAMSSSLILNKLGHKGFHSRTLSPHKRDEGPDARQETAPEAARPAHLLASGSVKPRPTAYPQECPLPTGQNSASKWRKQNQTVSKVASQGPES